MIVSLFGPDGVGKSTLSAALKRRGLCVFSGTGVASWPDQRWHNEPASRGLDETRINNAAHFLEKIQRAHTLARELSLQTDVVIDSDPLHKTLMHDFMKSASLVNRDIYTERRFQELVKLAQLTDDHIHIHLRISGEMTPEEQAYILYERVCGRGELAPFDPESHEESVAMVKACELISDLFRLHGNRVITIDTIKPIDESFFRAVLSDSRQV